MFAIGLKNGPVRIFVAHVPQNEAQAQCQQNEIVIPCTDYTKTFISSTGTLIASVPTLADTIAAKLVELSGKLGDLTNGSCTTPEGDIQVDLVSRTNITGAVNMAQMAKASNSDFSENWIMTDNSIATFTADQMIEIGQTVATFISNCYSVYTQARADINACTTITQVNKIDVSAYSWPN